MDWFEKIVKRKRNKMYRTLGLRFGIVIAVVFVAISVFNVMSLLNNNIEADNSNPDLVHFQVLAEYKDELGNEAYFKKMSLWHSLYRWEGCLHGIESITIDREIGEVTINYPNNYYWKIADDYDWIFIEGEHIHLNDWCKARGIPFEGSLKIN